MIQCSPTKQHDVHLEGRYDDPDLEASAKHTVVTLNGGDDGFFEAASHLNSLRAIH